MEGQLQEAASLLFAGDRWWPWDLLPAAMSCSCTDPPARTWKCWKRLKRAQQGNRYSFLIYFNCWWGSDLLLCLSQAEAALPHMGWKQDTSRALRWPRAFVPLGVTAFCAVCLLHLSPSSKPSHAGKWASGHCKPLSRRRGAAHCPKPPHTHTWHSFTAEPLVISVIFFLLQPTFSEPHGSVPSEHCRVRGCPEWVSLQGGWWLSSGTYFMQMRSGAQPFPGGITAFSQRMAHLNLH